MLNEPPSPSPATVEKSADAVDRQTAAQAELDARTARVAALESDIKAALLAGEPTSELHAESAQLNTQITNLRLLLEALQPEVIREERRQLLDAVQAVREREDEKRAQLAEQGKAVAAAARALRNAEDEYARIQSASTGSFTATVALKRHREQHFIDEGAL